MFLIGTLVGRNHFKLFIRELKFLNKEENYTKLKRM